MVSVKDRTMPESHGCSMSQQDLVLYLYDELPPKRRAVVEGHVGRMGGCRACLSDLSSLRASMAAADRVRDSLLGQAESGVDWDHEWARLEQRLRSVSPGRSLQRFGRIFPPSILKAAAVLLVAGASFAIGHQWDSLRSFPFGPLSISRGGRAPVTGSSEPNEAAPQDAEARIRFFSQQTHGYLNRSRLVLLEISNGRESNDATGLRVASLNLLRETQAARRIAGEMADARLEELTAQLEGILQEISRLSSPEDPATIARIRSELNQSGVLTQLELLCMTPARIAQERS